MSARSSVHLCGLVLLAGALAAGTSHATCPSPDLTVILNTGWDESTGGTPIAPGADDDDWDVLVDPSGGTTPADAGVIAAHPAWLTLPNSGWIAASQYGPNGTYVYETCWCMDGDAQNPVLSLQLRADDQADVYLNSVLILSLPDGTFNDTTPPGVSVTDPSLFQAGTNCLTVEVENKFGVVNGLNLSGTVTADDGVCCDCDESDSVADNGSTGIDDTTNLPIPIGTDDDEWMVIGSPVPGPLPRPARVVNTFSAWNVIPGTQWISDDLNGPNGSYFYEKCWCMNPGFQNASLDMLVLADDRARVFLNGTPIGGTPPANAFLFPATHITTSDQALFLPGKNCVQVQVDNTSSVVTGLDIGMTITAENAACCPCADLPPDAEAWWPLDETTGPTADELLNAHDGTWSTPPSHVPGPGMVGGSLFFNGLDQYIDVADDPGLDFGPAQDFSFDAWIKTASILRQSILHKREPGTPFLPGYAFMTAGVLLLEISDGTGLVVCAGTTNLADDAWHFVAATVDRDSPNGIVLYVDGVVDQVCDPTPILAGSLENAEHLTIAADPLNLPNARKWWRGNLDEIEIFRRALTAAEVMDLFLAGHSGKCPPTACEDSTGLPQCEGTCPEGETCVTSANPDVPCECLPETESCGETWPVCDGPCPHPGEACTENAIGGCSCEPVQLCEGMGAFPECDALCPPGYVCQSNGQRCHCVTPTPCELASFPICAGDCPVAGVECVPNAETGKCHCPIDPAPCEGFATYPACDGFCPDPDDVCVNNGQRCHCQNEPHCGDAGDFPTCDFACPPGFTCESNGATCACVEEVVECSDTFYPTCDGDCPDGKVCKNVVGTDHCSCQPEPVPCTSSPYPACDGICPANQKCRAFPNQTCGCLSCVIAVPSGPIVIHLGGGTSPLPATGSKKIRWTSDTCATVYNLYRGVGQGFMDGNGDGLADDYGSCYFDDIVGTEVDEPSEPQPGSLQWYLVTPENQVGEGTLGDNSAGQPRTPTNACP